ncbi:hypothetical protein MXM31_19990 [Klebsiella aerogenes]|uniref:hypothetical protein n=1 Tax=Klebsiella aerogenes TaxID=548 RepID=UPI002DBB3F00|nr:hypothetical protein [Klebsiella aerogenes]MEB5698432.1 hypothetical protein [Klebsiella aerogenes]
MKKVLLAMLATFSLAGCNDPYSLPGDYTCKIEEDYQPVKGIVHVNIIVEKHSFTEWLNTPFGKDNKVKHVAFSDGNMTTFTTPYMEMKGYYVNEIDHITAKVQGKVLVIREDEQLGTQGVFHKEYHCVRDAK